MDFRCLKDIRVVGAFKERTIVERKSRSCDSLAVLILKMGKI